MTRNQVNAPMINDVDEFSYGLWESAVFINSRMRGLDNIEKTYFELPRGEITGLIRSIAYDYLSYYGNIIFEMRELGTKINIPACTTLKSLAFKINNSTVDWEANGINPGYLTLIEHLGEEIIWTTLKEFSLTNAFRATPVIIDGMPILSIYLIDIKNQKIRKSLTKVLSTVSRTWAQ